MHRRWRKMMRCKKTERYPEPWAGKLDIFKVLVVPDLQTDLQTQRSPSQNSNRLSCGGWQADSQGYTKMRTLGQPEVREHLRISDRFKRTGLAVHHLLSTGSPPKSCRVRLQTQITGSEIGKQTHMHKADWFSTMWLTVQLCKKRETSKTAGYLDILHHTQKLKRNGSEL